MIRPQAARPAGQRLPGTVRKATISTPPAVSRQAATAIADMPVARASRLPARPPVPHSNPDVTRESRPVTARRRAAAAPVNVRIGTSLLRREGKGRGSGAHRLSRTASPRGGAGQESASAQPVVLRLAWLDAPGRTRADYRPARSAGAG